MSFFWYVFESLRLLLLYGASSWIVFNLFYRYEDRRLKQDRWIHSGKLTKLPSSWELTLRKLFCTDYDCKVTVIQDQEIWDRTLMARGLVKHWKAYIKMANRFPTIEGFKEYRKDFIDGLIETINGINSYEKLSFNLVQEKHEFPAPKKYLKAENVGHWLLSIDLVTANFQSLKFLDPELVLECQSWAEIARSQGADPALYNGKKLRQIVFGNCKPKVQQNVQKYLIWSLLCCLFKEESGRLDLKNLISKSNDEIIIRLDPEWSEEERLKFIENLQAEIEEHEVLGEILFHYRCFKLKQLDNEGRNWYLKEFADGTTKICQVPAKHYVQAWCHVFDCPVIPKDFWYQDGKDLYQQLNKIDFVED